ncbi:patatin-like phospholipase family protein [Natrinema sp. 1APR25-10V2]|uniref:patatin-like phospholipase family protein n=1 Tax=Natrinema sp. 1APR25-10V2 TaxID=2951081 RepID=UPI002875AF75|nr:patatin-like phospholipase family protein [Natrinema sp. 1APR25-10V2]MDS0477901.1 patatin-like phospholipase family protein [Natrinema sp. 1APR25-10V2]
MATDVDAGDSTRVAIACQGGGSHTAFTAGVLKRLLRECGTDSYELVGLSGTSGGAVCATAAWYGLATGGTDRAVATLDAVWRDLSAQSPFERLSNAWLVALARFAARGGPLPLFSPYELPTTDAGRARFLETLEAHIEFERFPALADDASTDLILGAADVTEGEFDTFRNGAVTAEAVLASAAIPTLFEAVGIGNHWYWDGLFSQNPPIRDFLTVPDRAAEKPDEIWIVQINPRYREEVPKSVEEIADRRNELAGNLSLYQEVDFIETINELIEDGSLPDEYKPVAVEFIDLGSDLSASSKVDRDPVFIDRLMQRGQRRAERFCRGRA